MADTMQAEKLCQLGKELIQEGKVEEAIVELRQATRADPENREAHLLLGEAYADLKEWEKATTAFQRAYDLGESPLIRVHLGESLLALGQTEEGLAHFDEVLDGLNTLLAEESPDPGEVGMFTGLVADAAQACQNAGQYTEAIGLYKRVIQVSLVTEEIGEVQDKVLTGLEEIYEAQGRSDELLHLLQQAIEDAPQHPLNYGRLGDFYARQQEFSKAIEQYQKAIELCEQQDEQELILVLRERIAQVHFDRAGILYLQEDKLDEAFAEAQRGLELAPDQPLGHNVLGFIYLGQDKLDEAVTEFQKIINSGEEFPVAYSGLALAQYDLGQNEEALASAEKALQMYSQSDDSEFQAQKEETQDLVRSIKSRMGEAELGYCQFPGCTNRAEYACDRCLKQYCQIHVGFDQVVPTTGFKRAWGRVVGKKIAPFEQKWSVICDVCISEIKKELTQG